MNQLKIFLSVLFIQLFIIPAGWAICRVSRNNPAGDLRTFQKLMSHINENGNDSGCEPKEANTGYGQGIKFIVSAYCKQHKSYCEVNKWTPGVSTIILSETLSLDQPSTKILIGNTDYHDSYGLPVLDATGYTKVDENGEVITNVFSCPNSGSNNYAFRNIVILTNGITREQILDLPCVGEYKPTNGTQASDDFFVCNGTRNADIEPGTAGWCDEVQDETGGTDADHDGYVAEEDGGDDCNDDNGFISPSSFEYPEDGIDQNCDDGIDGACEITVTPPTGSLIAGAYIGLAVQFKNVGGYKQDAKVAIDGNANFTLSGNPLVMKSTGSDVSENMVISAQNYLIPGTYKVTVRASSTYGNLAGTTSKYSCSESVKLTITDPSIVTPPADNDACVKKWNQNGRGRQAGLDICNDKSMVCTEFCMTIDQDDDGYCDVQNSTVYDSCLDGTTSEDCNDDDDTIKPGAPELECNDEVDNDCDGEIDQEDGDCLNVPGEVDCSKDVNCDKPECSGIASCQSTPPVPEAGKCGDKIDNDGDTYVDCEDELDCAGDPACVVVIDEDEDGYSATDDCNDADPLVHPYAREICDNKIDEDCDKDGEADETCSGEPTEDNDGDGYCEAVKCTDGMKPNDCDDNNAKINPNEDELCGNNIDENCDGNIASTEGGDVSDNQTTGNKTLVELAFAEKSSDDLLEQFEDELGTEPANDNSSQAAETVEPLNKAPEACIPPPSKEEIEPIANSATSGCSCDLGASQKSPLATMMLLWLLGGLPLVSVGFFRWKQNRAKL